MSQRNSIPIYIPSRGRADSCLTAKNLKQDHINFTIVVEPQDEKKYLAFYSERQLYVMDKNNAGIAYARNFCKKISIERGEKYHWQMDDNIKAFRIRYKNKNEKVSSEKIIVPAEDYFLRHKNVAMSCLRHTMFAWSQTKEISFNQCMYSAFMMKNDLPCSFKSGTVEDADFSLQVLMTGQCTVIFNKLLMEKETTGVMKGGNTEISYGGDGRKKRVEGLCKQWPGGFKIIIKNGVPKVHPVKAWIRFKQRPIKK
jgi:hypothetical protein